jgi:hypothetical protein
MQYNIVYNTISRLRQPSIQQLRHEINKHRKIFKMHFTRVLIKQTLENTEWTIKNGQSREIGNIGYTRRRQEKQIHNTICVGHQYTQTNSNNVNKTA